MKPIEAGCLALVIGDPDHPENVGKVVTVVKYINKGDILSTWYRQEGRQYICAGNSTDNKWLLQGDLISIAVLNFNTAEGRTTIEVRADSYQAENGEEGQHALLTHQLMRIDDFSDEDKQKDREQEIGRGLLKPVVWTGDQYSNVE